MNDEGAHAFVVHLLLMLDVLAGWRIAVRIEGVSYYLACLATGGVSSRPEVRQVARTAWLSYSSAWVAGHYTQAAQPPDEGIESVGSGHILILLAAWGLG